jgi:hypothetical protein
VPARRVAVWAGSLAVAGFASIGAGAIHATAIGTHREETQAAVAFTILTVFQLAWGAVALMTPTRRVAVIGALGSAAALAGWGLAKVSGIWFVNGLDEAESIQWADGLAALLAAVALAGALSVVFGRGIHRVSRRRSPAILATAAVLVTALTVMGMSKASDHSHAGGGHAHGDTAAGAGAGAGHDHGGGDGGTGHEAGIVPPKEYDPNLPIDLGGVPGVTPEQQARAENLIAITLARLPQFADPAAAEAAGYRSIGDALTGDEHYVNWSLINDDKILDPDHPESLVYQVRDGKKTLVAAMFMLADGSTLDTVPDIGGPLTQWHIHNNLCFTPSPDAARVAGVVPPDRECRPGTVRKITVPMIHVWIVKHPCGPFAALEGIGGGQIKEGETKLCDHAHGSA